MSVFTAPEKGDRGLETHQQVLGLAWSLQPLLPGVGEGGEPRVCVVPQGQGLPGTLRDVGGVLSRIWKQHVSAILDSLRPGLEQGAKFQAWSPIELGPPEAVLSQASVS